MVAKKAGESAVALCAAQSQLPAVRAAFAGFPLVAFWPLSLGSSRFSRPDCTCNARGPAISMVVIIGGKQNDN